MLAPVSALEAKTALDLDDLELPVRSSGHYLTIMIPLMNSSWKIV